MNDFLHKERRWFWSLSGLVVLATLIAFVLSATAKPMYVTSLSIAVNRVSKQTVTPYYEYDGYYAIQASDLFSQTLLSWFLTPSVLQEIYSRAGIDPRIQSLTELVGRFRARKFAAQNIVVQFSDPDRTAAEKLAAAIADVVRERGTALDKTAEGSATFDVVPAAPLVVETRPNIVLHTVATFFASVLIALALVSVARYIRR